MTTWVGYQPRWAEFKQGRPQENMLQTFPVRADTLCVLGIHVGPAAKQGQGPQAHLHWSLCGGNLGNFAVLPVQLDRS